MLKSTQQRLNFLTEMDFIIDLIVFPEVYLYTNHFINWLLVFLSYLIDFYVM